jgi:solute carrier family 25 (mitochondrial carnitine/acylcarnitine transporter), member 20/29
MQTGGAELAGQSVTSIFIKTFRDGGIRGLYRGVSAPLLAVTPLFATCFWGYDMGQRLVLAVNPEKVELTLVDKCFAGGFSAIPTTALMAPSERIKCLLQTNKGKYNGFFDCATAVYKEGGIRSVYRGTGATLMRDIPGSIAWFGVYEAAKRAFLKAQGIEDMSRLSPVAVLTAGGLAGMACWSVSIPFDVLKSRLQTAPTGKYNGIVDVYKTLMKEEGWTALFTGLRPAMIRAFPANAAYVQKISCFRAANNHDSSLSVSLNFFFPCFSLFCAF